MILKRIFSAALLLTAFLPAGFAQDYPSLKAEAEKFYAEKSFAKAHEIYSRAIVMSNISSNEARWVFFRHADTLWRSQFATQTADTTKIDQAREWLEQALRETKTVEGRDQTWVEVQESLGDFYWTRRNNNNWGAAWPYYQQALDWWAGARDIEKARERYLAIVWRMARPPGVQRDYYYGYWGNTIPIDVLENALKIAKSEEDKAHAHFLLAMSLRQQAGDAEQRARVVDEFEGALKLGKKTDWYDDALYNFAEWMASQGRAIILKNGGQTFEPDYVRALELFRKLVAEFNKGESRYWEQAQQQIKNITEPQVSVSVGNIFLPDSEIQYYLGWRNVKEIDLALYAVELNRDVKFTEKRQDWLHAIDVGSLEKMKSWTHDAKDKGDYKPGYAIPRLDKLKPGAYLLEAKAGGKDARELILVTDAAMVLKSSGSQALVYFCNALNGSPLANGKVKLWEQWWENNQWRVREQTKETGADGIAVFDLEQRAHRNLQLFASAIREDRQAFSPGNSYGYGRNTEPWKIYAFTDRPAYRPKETVNWKFIARRHNGSVYSTPSDQVVEYEIHDPRGAKIKSDKATLNTFGSAWGSVELTEQMPLGEYRVHFYFQEGNSKRQIGSAMLFRLEEYKLPEFKVTVTTPEEDGRKKAFRVGDKVEAEIQADYYFGGPVANASVEVLVYQNPFYQYWHKPREFPWFYDDMDNQNRWNRWYGGGQIVKRETIKTDATGKARITFDTPRGSGQDYEYRVEARVTDSSRREIVGNGNVRVTRQRYYVYAHADHNIYRPQDKAKVEFKAIDANDQPVTTEGTVRVTRDYWWEIWISPEGKEVKGDELKALRDKVPNRIWPPPPSKPNEPGWRLKFRGYEHDEILTQTVKTDTNGVAEFSFTPERDGYYRVAWTSEDEVAKKKNQVANPIRAETTIWVCSTKSTEIGYRYQGVQIIADKDTFRVGNEAPIMLVAPTSDRYVLFTVEGEDLYHYRLVHLEGTVKLIDLLIEEKHVPNIFLGAALVSDRQIYMDTKQIVVPPTKNFLTVDVKSDRAQYQPREEGTLTVTTKNDEGKPVSAEVALSLVDESVFYIQSDYAGDPRQFYYGTKRNHAVQTQATMNQKSYTKLILGEKDELLDERDAEREKSSRSRRQAGYDYDERQEAAMPADESRDKMESLSSVNQFKSRLGGAARGAMATPAAPAPAMTAALADGAAVAEGKELANQPPGGQEPAVQVRSDFRSTILWQPDVKTDAKGTATVKVKYPDSLTGWKATARAASSVNQFGIGNATTRTKQPLIVRLQAPRFFVVGDTVTISAVVNNNTDEAMNVSLEFDAAGGVNLEGTSGRTKTATIIRELNVHANGELRADWKVEVKSPGEVKFKVTGRSAKYADAMEKSYIAHEHGIEKFISKSGKARGSDILVKLDLPKERKSDSTSLTVQVTPSLAVTMLDALPYLIDYPYGCTEQTMSRFLPTVITAKTLRDVGLDPEDVMGRLFGGIETNTAAATHPHGKKNMAELDAMTKAGLERLYDFQHSDGGWGWWKDGSSDQWMTAYVVWGLSMAFEAGVDIKRDVIARGTAYLDKTLVEQEENHDMQAFMLHAIAAEAASHKRATYDPSPAQDKAFENLWKNREQLNAYTRALLALSAHYFKATDKAKRLIENLENGVKRDERPDTSVLVGGKPENPGVMGTAHWGEDGIYWRWSDGGVEATAFALRALLTIDPKNKLIEPVTNWLIKNRRGAQWSNTRDTAIVVLAMNDYLRVSGELKPELEYELIVNGKSIAKKKVSGVEVFNAPSRFVVDAKLIKEANEIRIKRKDDKTPVYFAVEGKFFSLEEPITAAGNEIFVKREYFKLVGRPTLLKGYVYDKEPLRDGETVKSGERVETLVTIEAKNNYEYLLFEDLKPAGFEAAEIRSGESLFARELKSGAVERKFGKAGDAAPTKSNAAVAPARARGDRRVAGSIAPPRPQPVPEDTGFTGRQRWVYQELRDRKVALFLDKLPEGVWEIRYDLRAEVPGKFHALPVVGHAMYVPEIRCNGTEVRVNVEDAK